MQEETRKAMQKEFGTAALVLDKIRKMIGNDEELILYIERAKHNLANALLRITMREP